MSEPTLDSLSAQIDDCSRMVAELPSVAEHRRVCEERDEARAAVSAWESVFSGIEAHIMDRVAMSDPASPETYLSIIRYDVGELPHRSKQIYAASHHRARSSDARAEAAEAEHRRCLETVAALREALEAAAEAIKSWDNGDPSTETGWMYDELLEAWLAAQAALALARDEPA